MRKDKITHIKTTIRASLNSSDSRASVFHPGCTRAATESFWKTLSQNSTLDPWDRQLLEGRPSICAFKAPRVILLGLLSGIYQLDMKTEPHVQEYYARWFFSSYFLTVLKKTVSYWFLQIEFTCHKIQLCIKIYNSTVLIYSQTCMTTIKFQTTSIILQRSLYSLTVSLLYSSLRSLATSNLIFVKLSWTCI